ncbi:hypothetical protein ACU686_00430 [Yinghuangia aomiensis]
MRQADPDGVVAGYAGEIVALLTAVPGQGGSGTARDAAGRVRTACARIPRTFSTGISRPVRGLPGCRRRTTRRGGRLPPGGGCKGRGRSRTSTGWACSGCCRCCRRTGSWSASRTRCWGRWRVRSMRKRPICGGRCRCCWRRI